MTQLLFKLLPPCWGSEQIDESEHIGLSLLVLWDKSPTSLQSQMLWGFSFPVLVPWSGEPKVGLDLLTAPGDPVIIFSLPFRSHHTGDVGPDKTTSQPLLLSWYGLFFLSLFINNESVLLVFGSFLEIAVLYAMVVLV